MRAPEVRLSLYYFAFFAHAGAFLSYFALYLTTLGFSAAEVATVVAMPQLARVVAPGFWGWLADTRFTRRGIVVFASAATLGGTGALSLIEGPVPMGIALLAMSFASAGAGPLVEAMTLQALEGRPGAYGPVRLWGSVGFIAAVLATGAWLDRRPPAMLMPVLLALAAGTVMASLALPRGAVREHRASAAPLAGLLGRPGVGAFFAASICMSAAHGTLYVFFSVYLDALGHSKSVIGALWTLGVLAEIVLFLRLAPLMQRYSLRVLLLAAFLAAAVRFGAVGLCGEWVAVLAALQLLHAFTFGAFHAASVAAVHRMFPPGVAGRGQALYSSLSYGLGGAAGSLVAGLAWEPLGPQGSFAVSALFALAGGTLVAWKVRV